MALQPFALAELPETPWKNGGGTTREIVCWPPGAGLDAFDWRISIARIAADGPFSAFAGIERTIVLLEGSGVRLRSDDGRLDHRLDTPLAPFSFAGDLPLRAELLGGPCSDFNVMVRRGRVRVQVEVITQAGQLAGGAGGLLLAWQGRWTLQPHGAAAMACEARHGAWWTDPALAVGVEPQAAGAALLSVRLLSP